MSELLHDLWNHLTPDQQRQVYSFAWSLSLNASIISLLAFITYEASRTQPMVIQAGFEEGDLDAQELSVFESASLEVSDRVEEAQEPLEVTLPVVDLASLMPEELKEATKLPSSGKETHSGAANNAQQIAEVNRRVKAGGGKLDAPIRISLIFPGSDDLDLHVQYAPGSLRNHRNDVPFRFGGIVRNYVWFGQPVSQHAELDLDANARFLMPEPAENIVFHNIPDPSTFAVAVHMFRNRSGRKKTPYTVYIQYGETKKIVTGEISLAEGYKPVHQFNYP